MELNEDDDNEPARVPGSGALILIGVIGILIIVGFLYSVMTG
jgi:hypothetical protein